jgi:zinc transport system substrate-binding protein
MKKIVLMSLLIFITPLFAKLDVVVSIQPEIEFVQKIGGDKVNVYLMVKRGASPHTYEPKPMQMRKLTKARLYLAIGVEFEKSWLSRFKNQNRNLQIIDISKDVKKIKNNPHIWVVPKNIKTIVGNIFKALSSIDRKNINYYRANFNKYIQEIEQIDNKIKDILKDTPKGSSFMVFHPAWGYFAKEYNLRELVIEINGRSPRPRELIQIIQKAKKEHIKVIFTQPEFSDKTAQIVAEALNIKIIKVSPLAKNWKENLINLAEAIAHKESY